MSTANGNLLEFAEKVSRNSSLQRQLTAIKPGNTSSFITLASTQGYNFSIEELQQAVREISPMANGENDELSDAQLDNVSGGLVVNAIIAVLIGLLVPAVQKVR